MDAKLEEDIITLENALRKLIQTMKRPATWAKVTADAGVQLDRPAATTLHVLVAYQPKAYRLQELAQTLGIEAPSMTRKVQQLEQSGLVERQTDPIDKRASVIRITAKGLAVTKLLRKVQRQYFEKLLQPWDPADRKQFALLFSRFAEEMNGMYQTKQS